MDARTGRAAWPSALVLAMGVLWTIYLQTTVRKGVFTQGDLGMKFLLTRQLAAGELALDLRLPGDPWVKALWAQGLHPFPFAVRSRGGREYLFHPVTFPLVSAPFYRWLGFRGLYVLPLAGTWLTWVCFVRFARRYGVRDPWRAVMLAFLVFASPLTFYSATFWEHTLAVALSFTALALALAPPAPRPLGAAASFAAGAVLTLGGWLREELLFLAGIAAVLFALPERLFRRLPAASVQRWPFVAGLLTMAALFLTANLAIYGQALGVHAEPFVEWLGWSHRARAAAAARFLAGALLDHYPLGVVILVALAVSWWRKGWSATARPAVALAVCLAFCAVVPVLARHEGGRQFGPRFLLVVFPLSALAGGALLRDAFDASGRLARAVLAVALAGAAVLGVRANAVEAERHLRVNYERRFLSYQAVRDEPAQAVAVSHEFVAQQLTDLLGRKAFFLTRRAVELKQLGRELLRQGQPRFIYLCYPQYPCGPFSALPAELILHADQRPVLAFRKRGQFDRYVLYEGTATDRAAGPAGHPAR